MNLFQQPLLTLDPILSKPEACGSVGKKNVGFKCPNSIYSVRPKPHRVRVGDGGGKTAGIKPMVTSNLCFHTCNTSLYLQPFYFQWYTIQLHNDFFNTVCTLFFMNFTFLMEKVWFGLKTVHIVMKNLNVFLMCNGKGKAITTLLHCSKKVLIDGDY